MHASMKATETHVTMNIRCFRIEDRRAGGQIDTVFPIVPVLGPGTRPRVGPLPLRHRKIDFGRVRSFCFDIRSQHTTKQRFGRRLGGKGATSQEAAAQGPRCAGRGDGLQGVPPTFR